jgi:O-succinylbenzoic acid--CoA ligase
VISEKKVSFLDILKREEITHLSLVYPQFYELICSEKVFPSLKHILLGGSAFNESLLKKAVQKKLPIHFSYGLTEYSSQVATSLIGTYRPLFLLPSVESYSDSNNQIYLKGPALFQGYLNKEGQIYISLDSKGYFKTEDLGDSINDQLHIKGRKDNLFISGGENIQPEEIEGILMQIPEVDYAIVLPISNDYFGFRPVALIKFNQVISEKKIRDFLALFLPKYKIPDAFIPWPHFLSVTDKIKRSRLISYIQKYRCN